MIEKIVRLFPWLSVADPSKDICHGQLAWGGRVHQCVRCGRVLKSLPLGRMAHYPPPFIWPTIQVTPL